MTRSLFCLMLLAASQLSVAQAQAPAQVQERMVIQGERRGEPVRVQVGIGFFVPGPTDDGEEATSIRDRARRAIYVMAMRECDLLREVMAGDCRLESINVNLNRQSGQQVGGLQVNGNLVFRMTAK